MTKIKLNLVKINLAFYIKDEVCFTWNKRYYNIACFLLIIY